VRDFLEKELLSMGLTYAALGRMDVVGRLLRVFLRVGFPWLYWIVISWLLLTLASVLLLLWDMVRGTLATWRMRMIWAMVVPWRALVTTSVTGEATAVEEPSTSRVKILLFILVTYIVLFGVVFWLLNLS
jgi:hypothetical protein